MINEEPNSLSSKIIKDIYDTTEEHKFDGAIKDSCNV